MAFASVCAKCPVGTANARTHIQAREKVFCWLQTILEPTGTSGNDCNIQDSVSQTMEKVIVQSFMHAKEVNDYDPNMLTSMARLAAPELVQAAQSASANVCMLALHYRLCLRTLVV